MNAFLKLLLVALMFVIAMYLVELVIPAQSTLVKNIVAGLVVGAIDIWVLDRKVETRGYKLNFAD